MAGRLQQEEKAAAAPLSFQAELPQRAEIAIEMAAYWAWAEETGTLEGEERALADPFYWASSDPEEMGWDGLVRPALSAHAGLALVPTTGSPSR